MSEQHVSVLKLVLAHPYAKRPVQATKGARGFDVYAAKIEEESDYFIIYDTGLIIQDPHFKLAPSIVPRSSVYKTGLIFSNCIGIGDPDYTGTLKLVFYKGLKGKEPYYKVGDRIGQLLFLAPEVPIAFKVVDKDAIEVTERGSGGHGSTGRN